MAIIELFGDSRKGNATRTEVASYGKCQGLEYINVLRLHTSGVKMLADPGLTLWFGCFHRYLATLSFY